MKRDQLIEQVQIIAGIKTKTEADKIVRAIFETIVKIIVTGEEVRIAGFGVFKIRDRKEREGRNPRTGEKITIPAKRGVKFRASKDLKEAVKSEGVV